MDDETPTQVQSEAPAAAETAPVPTSEADVQTTNDTPEVTQGEGEQSQEVKTEETVGETLYAGKYKTAEDLEKAYLSAQSEASRMANEKAELSKILSEAFTADEPASVQTADDDYLEDAPNPLAREVEALKRNQAITDFIFANPNADGDAILKVLQTDPTAKDITSYEAKLRYAHAVSQNTAQPKVVEEAKKQAQVDTQAKIAEKQAAQVESASKQSPPTENEPLTPEQIRAASRDDKAFGDMLKKNFPGISQMMN